MGYFFDLYLLINKEYDNNILNTAIINTFHLRGTHYEKNYILEKLNKTFRFYRIEELYQNFAKKNKYAKDVSFKMCKIAILTIYSKLKFLDKIYLANYQIELHLIRHGEEKRDKTGGWSDNHLTKYGEDEVRALLPKIETYDLFLSSDLTRAIETSKIINSKLSMEIVLDKTFEK